MKRKVIIQKIKESPYWPLFKHMSDEHGLSLLDTEMQDIIHVVNSIQQIGKEQLYISQLEEQVGEEIAHRILDVSQQPDTEVRPLDDLWKELKEKAYNPTYHNYYFKEANQVIRKYFEYQKQQWDREREELVGVIEDLLNHTQAARTINKNELEKIDIRFAPLTRKAFAKIWNKAEELLNKHQ